MRDVLSEFLSTVRLWVSVTLMVIFMAYLRVILFLLCWVLLIIAGWNLLPLIFSFP